MLKVEYEGQTVGMLPVKPREYSTGSVGFNVCGKIQIGTTTFQVTGNLVGVHSKNW